MKTFEKIIYGLYVMWWIFAPFIVKEILLSRNIILPRDISSYGSCIWYAIGLGQMAWLTRNDPDPPKSRHKDRPSYTDRGQNDWP